MIVVVADGTVKSIGFQSENERTTISMSLQEIADIVTAYPGGTYTLTYKRQNDRCFLISENFTVDNGNMIITVDAPMLAVKGIVELQAIYTCGTKIASTSVYKFRVRRAIMDGETMPTTFVDLLSSALVALDATAKRAEAAADRAEAAAEEAVSASVHTPIIGQNGNWFVWSQGANDYVDTNLPSRGEDGEDGQDGADGVGIVSITKTSTSGLVDIYTVLLTNGNTATFEVTNGADGQDGQDGQDGKDGYSPSAAVSKSGSTTTITITDKTSTTTATVSDGADGQDGQDGQNGADGVGIQSITKTGTSGNVDTYTITLTNGNTSTFTVTNGNAVIDDTAGTGDTTKVWSANKSATELASVNSALMSRTINMFDPSYLVSIAGWTKNRDVYSGTASKLHQNFNTSPYYPISGFKENTRYTISLKAYTDQDEGSSGNGIMVNFIYSDSSSDGFGISNGTTVETNFTRTSASGKTVVGLRITYGGNGGNVWHLRNVQVEEGARSTVYIPYETAADYVARNEINSRTGDADTLNLFSIYNSESGYINGSGEVVVTTSNNVRVSGYIPVKPNTDYTLVFGATTPSNVGVLWGCLAQYNSSKTMVGSRTQSEPNVGVNTFGISVIHITTESTTAYIRTSIRYYSDGFMALYEGDKNCWCFASPSNELISFEEQQKTRELANIAMGSHVKAINHAGWHEAPEDTLPAYKQSKLHGFYYVETDVSFTSDDVPVLLHDNTINRTGRNADGSTISETINIADITYAEALEYDFGIYKGAQYAGTKIPTLEQFVTLCRNLGLHPYIEIKSSNPYTKEQVQSCVNIVKNLGMSNDVTWCSFSSTFLGYIKEVAPNARFGYILSTITDEGIAAAETLASGGTEVIIMSSSYTASEVNKCIAADIPLEIWTIGSIAGITGANPYISGIISGNLNASQVLYEYSIT